MKYLLVLAAVVAGVLAQDSRRPRPDFNKYRKNCIDKLGLTPEEQEHAKSFHSNDPLTPKCYPQCLMKQVGMYGDDGFNIDVVVEHSRRRGPNLNVTKVRQDLELCITDNKDDDKCVEASKVVSCFWELYGSGQHTQQPASNA